MVDPEERIRRTVSIIIHCRDDGRSRRKMTPDPPIFVVPVNLNFFNPVLVQ